MTGGKVYHSYSDHVSLLKFIERNWFLRPLTNRSRDNFPNPKMAKNNLYVPTNSPASTTCSTRSTSTMRSPSLTPSDPGDDHQVPVICDLVVAAPIGLMARSASLFVCRPNDKVLAVDMDDAQGPDDCYVTQQSVAESAGRFRLSGMRDAGTGAAVFRRSRHHAGRWQGGGCRGQTARLI